MSQETQVQIIQPSNPLEVLNLIDVKSCERFAHDMAALVKEGHVDPIQVRVLISAWEKAFKSLKTAIDPETEREAMKHGKSFDFMGAKCEWVPVSTEYDYSHSGDPEWNDTTESISILTESRKEREKFLKTIKEPIDIRVGDELVTIKPPLKKQKDGLKITIK